MVARDAMPKATSAGAVASTDLTTSATRAFHSALPPWASRSTPVVVADWADAAEAHRATTATSTLLTGRLIITSIDLLGPRPAHAEARRPAGIRPIGGEWRTGGGQLAEVRVLIVGDVVDRREHIQAADDTLRGIRVPEGITGGDGIHRLAIDGGAGRDPVAVEHAAQGGDKV